MWFNPDCPRNQQAGSVIVKSLVGFIMGRQVLMKRAAPLHDLTTP